MATFLRYWPGTRQPAEQWDDAAGTYTAWDEAGHQLVSRAFATGESAQTGAATSLDTIWLRAGGLALLNNLDRLAAGVDTDALPTIVTDLLRQTNIMFSGMAFLVSKVTALTARVDTLETDGS